MLSACSLDLRLHYREILQKEFKSYQQQVNKGAEPLDIPVSLDSAGDELEELCESQTVLQTEVDQPEDEITRYLAKGLTKGNPRLSWKDHEHEYPVLAKLARDILSVPASGAGIERLFNCARDICNYRRGQLKPDTIKDLMLHLFSSEFDLEKGKLEMVKEYLSPGDAAIADQTRKPVPTLDELEPISDNEEEGYEVDGLSDDSDDESDKEHALTPTQITTQKKHTQRKRPRSAAEPPEDSDNSLPLPEVPNKECTQGRSGRIRKKPKLPDGFEIDRL